MCICDLEEETDEQFFMSSIYVTNTKNTRCPCHGYEDFLTGKATGPRIRKWIEATGRTWLVKSCITKGPRAKAL